MFAAWLKRIVVNKSINALQAKATYQGYKGEWTPEDEDEQVDAPYSAAQVRDAILALPDGYRTVLSLYLLEGYDHEEIGEILGITSATSRSQYNRGKKKLRETLTQDA